MTSGRRHEVEVHGGAAPATTRGAGASCWMPSPSIQVRYQSSRFKSAQMVSPCSPRPRAVLVEDARHGRHVEHAALPRAPIEQHVPDRDRATPGASTRRTALESPSSDD